MRSKTIALCLALGIAASITACGGSEAPEGGAGTEATPGVEQTTTPEATPGVEQTTTPEATPDATKTPESGKGS